MRGSATLLLAALALAGCGRASQGEAVQKQEAARAAEVAKATGWNRAFQPDVALAAANQFGFRPSPYAAATGGFASTGGPVTIANSYAKAPNRIGFAARGTAADKLDSIAFALDLTDAESAAMARKRTADLVRDYLFQSKIDAKPIHAAIEAGTPGKGTLAGAGYAIDSTPKQLIVTFTRSGASAPANS